MLVEILIFNVFHAEKLKNRKNETNLQQNLAKTGFLKFAPKHWSSVLFPQKMFLHIFRNENVFLAEKQNTKMCFKAPKRWSKYTSHKAGKKVFKKTITCPIPILCAKS